MSYYLLISSAYSKRLNLRKHKFGSVKKIFIQRIICLDFKIIQIIFKSISSDKILIMYKVSYCIHHIFKYVKT